MTKNRIIALIDMDCFYVQVEQRCNPELREKPTAVVQYNQWRKGGIIAVGYEARAKGVKRGMRGEDATAICPEINLVSVPCQRGKADLTKYRSASEEVFKTIFTFENVTIERASIDEAYLDLTEAVENEYLERYTPFQLNEKTFASTHLASSEVDFQDWLKDIQEKSLVDDIKLALGARLVESVRSKILNETKFNCSAGISYNKMLAKLVCSLNKPRKQTICSRSMVSDVFAMTPIQNVRLLGGILGNQVIEKLGVSTMKELSAIPLSDLEKQFSECTAKWLHDLSRGEDDEPVIARQLPKSVGCSKNFPGKSSLKTKQEVNHWLQQLCEELEERLTRDHQANHRLAKTLIVGIRTEGDSTAVNCSRQTALPYYSADAFVKEATKLLQEFNSTSKESTLWKPAIVCLSVGASKFEDSVDSESMPITDFFKPVASNIEPLIPSPAKPTSETTDCVIPKNSATFGKNLKSFFGQITVDKIPSPQKEQKADLQPTQEDEQTGPIAFKIGFPSTSKNVSYSTTNDIIIDDEIEIIDSNDRVTPASVHSAGSDDLFICKQGTSKQTSTPVEDIGNRFSPSLSTTLDLPENFGDLSKEAWQELPADIRFEITQHYKRQRSNNNNSSTNSDKISNSNRRKKLGEKNKKVTGAKNKSPPKKSKKSLNNGATLFDYYNKL